MASLGLAQAEKLRVLTTIAPMTTLAMNVAGDAATVEQLLPPGAEPHDFALAPADLKKIARADVVIENGLGLEEWLGPALRGSRAARIVASSGIESDDGNPHLWLDPLLAMRQAENIRRGLVERDPAHAAEYNRNAAAFTETLRTLDAEIRQATAALPNKRLLPFHDAFHYFAKRYGFEVVGVLEAFPGREPPPRALRQLENTIREKHVTVLFTEPRHAPAALRSLAETMKLPIVEIDPMEQGEPTAGLYEATMRSNLHQLQEALHAR
jgi:zinc/manganese transport system substrate-binding protein